MCSADHSCSTDSSGPRVCFPCLSRAVCQQFYHQFFIYWNFKALHWFLKVASWIYLKQCLQSYFKICLKLCWFICRRRSGWLLSLSVFMQSFYWRYFWVWWYIHWCWGIWIWGWSFSVTLVLFHECWCFLRDAMCCKPDTGTWDQILTGWWRRSLNRGMPWVGRDPQGSSSPAPGTGHPNNPTVSVVRG